jgi:hypothetical protein
VTSTAALAEKPPVRQTMRRTSASRDRWQSGFRDDVVGQLQRDAIGKD